MQLITQSYSSPYYILISSHKKAIIDNKHIVFCIISHAYCSCPRATFLIIIIVSLGLLVLAEVHISLEALKLITHHISREELVVLIIVQ
jgi:hypothetical protein